MKSAKKINSKITSTRLHPDILKMLFEHKGEVFRKLSDLKKLYLIEHISVNIVNPNQEIAIFSLTPSIEFNLIASELWRFDKTFFPSSYSDGSLIWWEDAYDSAYFNELQKIKKTDHNITLGFNLVKKVDSFQLVYSFATRHYCHNLKSYMAENMDQLMQIGNYGYRLISNIYSRYSKVLPVLRNDGLNNNNRSHLKLISNK